MDWCSAELRNLYGDWAVALSGDAAGESDEVDQGEAILLGAYQSFTQICVVQPPI
jgi:hypothetical protein